jgi:hydroxypyruvate isomerase
MFDLAVCAEMVFLDLPVPERVRRIADLGFQVEIWDWTGKDVDTLARTGAVFSSMIGYATGTLTDDDGAAELLASAERSVAVAERLGCPRLNLHGTGLRMMLDLYHAQIGEGNLIELLRRAGPLIGEVQVADVPGRCEPGTGEINYPAVAWALDELGYRGTVGLEAWASGDSEQALSRFREAFAVPDQDGNATHPA